MDDIPCEVEFVADPADDPDDLYVKEFGGGVMLVVSKEFVPLFLMPADTDFADLMFLSRSQI